MAYGISFDDGHLLAPYKIIYLLLGGLAILVGVCVVIWLPDSPVHARTLSKEERIAALERVRNDQGGIANKTLKKEQAIEALLDVRTWLIALTTLLSMCLSVCVVTSLTFPPASIPNGALSNCKLSYARYRSSFSFLLSQQHHHQELWLHVRWLSSF